MVLIGHIVNSEKYVCLKQFKVSSITLQQHYILAKTHKRKTDLRSILLTSIIGFGIKFLYQILKFEFKKKPKQFFILALKSKNPLTYVISLLYSDSMTGRGDRE